MTFSAEYLMPIERLPKNVEPIDPFFGPFLQLLRRSLGTGSSELALGLSLFSLAVSIRATRLIEIGRFKGFSTLALASALRFLDMGWTEPRQNQQRPDVDYMGLELPQERKLFSIDPTPTREAAALLAEAQLEKYVVCMDQSSKDCVLEGAADLILIDGDHGYEACKRDVLKFVPNHLRPGGYFVLHDYFGWYEGGVNRSPIKAVTDEIAAIGQFQRLLVDTHYSSFVIFRKPNPQLDG